MSKKPRRQAEIERREKIRQEFYQAVDSGTLTLRQGVRQFRKMLGLNQREFAKYVDVSPRILMAFEQGTGNPTLHTVEKMLKGSGLDLILRRKPSGLPRVKNASKG